MTAWTWRGDALIAADGLWSRVREQLLTDGPPRVAGHLAYRAMLPQASLPAALRSQQVTAWLGPRLHVVQYPVRGGEWLNVVAIVHGHVQGGLEDWDHGANAADLQAALGHTCAALRNLIAAVPDWRLWVLCDRPPVGAADQMARGHVALLGDAAHPMRPYLAQGAGMAIEDAAELARQVALVDGVLDVPTLLQRYALNRWQRCARVQARFHPQWRDLPSGGAHGLGTRCFAAPAGRTPAGCALALPGALTLRLQAGVAGPPWRGPGGSRRCLPRTRDKARGATHRCRRPLFRRVCRSGPHSAAANGRCRAFARCCH